MSAAVSRVGERMGGKGGRWEGRVGVVHFVQRVMGENSGAEVEGVGAEEEEDGFWRLGARAEVSWIVGGLVAAGAFLLDILCVWW